VTKESGMRRRIIDVLTQAGLHPVAVENPACPGTPDVNHVQGWIELKQIKEWPSKSGSMVRVEHFTQQQRIWLRNRCRFGGRAHLLIRVGCDWLLLDGRYAADALGVAPKHELIAHAVAYWPKRLNEEELVRCLKTTPRPT
jgi:hypothetical protein